MIPTPPVSLPTPQTIISSTPAPASERAILDAGLDEASQDARALGGTLGAAVIDLNSGAMASRNADRSLPLESVQKLAIATLAYHLLDAGALRLDTATAQSLVRSMLVGDESAAEQSLIQAMGGIDAVNATLRELGYDAIVAASDDGGYGTPSALARLLTDLHDGHLMRPASSAALIDMLSAVQKFPGRLRAGLPPETRLAHKTGTSAPSGTVRGATNDVGIVYFRGRTMIVVAMLATAGGSDAARDAVIAGVARAAANAAASLTP